MWRCWISADSTTSCCPANPACAANPQQPANPADLEDNMSIGLLFTLGKFRMLDLADLEAAYEYKLVCPNNLIGTVDVYQVSGHGQDKSVSGVVEAAIHARVAMMGNGPRKGGSPSTWPILRNAAGLEDIWQVHLSLAGGAENNPPEDYRSEEHTSELQSLRHLVCRLLLEKKKK